MSPSALGDAKDLESPPYQARIQAWKDCNGNPEAFLLAVAIAPEDRECVVAMQIGATSQTDRDIAQHIINTAEVDCVAVDTPSTNPAPRHKPSTTSRTGPAPIGLEEKAASAPLVGLKL